MEPCATGAERIDGNVRMAPHTTGWTRPRPSGTLEKIQPDLVLIRTTHTGVSVRTERSGPYLLRSHPAPTACISPTPPRFTGCTCGPFRTALGRTLRYYAVDWTDVEHGWFLRPDGGLDYVGPTHHWKVPVGGWAVRFVVWLQGELRVGGHRMEPSVAPACRRTPCLDEFTQTPALPRSPDR